MTEIPFSWQQLFIIHVFSTICGTYSRKLTDKDLFCHGFVEAYVDHMQIRVKFGLSIINRIISVIRYDQRVVDFSKLFIVQLPNRREIRSLSTKRSYRIIGYKEDQNHNKCK